MIYIVSIENDLATQEISNWLDYYRRPYKIVDITFIVEEFGFLCSRGQPAPTFRGAVRVQ